MTKLFSIKQKYSEKIFNKQKLVEFRRQNVNVYKNETCLIYTSSPIQKITGYFIVKGKIRTNIGKLWEITKEYAGISFREFKEYFDGCKMGTAIIFKFVRQFKEALSLDKIRERIKAFRPPQSYYNLNGLLLNYFMDHLLQRRLIHFIN